MTPSLRSTIAALFPCLLVCTVLALPVEAVVVPTSTPLDKKAFRHPNLHIPSLEQPSAEFGVSLGPQSLDLVRLGVGPASAFYDWRGARWGSLILSQPLIPGDGKGNNLGTARVGNAEIWKALSGYVALHQPELRVDLSELATPRIGIFDGGNLVQVHAQRVVDGITVRDSGLTAVINHGNLILLGLQNWGTLAATPKPGITKADAEAAAAAYVRPFTVSGYKQPARLELIPMAQGDSLANVAAGAGYDYHLSWVITARIGDDLGTWESLVDATTGKLIAFQDTNDYAARRMQGGVYPVSNDQRPPDGIEQAGWPMPFADVAVGGNNLFTDSGGTIGCSTGNATSALNGRFIRIQDTCGPISETSAAGDLDLEFGPTPTATDCVVPAGHSAGDTKSSRSGFYELNRIKEQAKGHLTSGPPNAWLNAQLTSNMNLNQTCNAFWDGSSVNFFKDSGSPCRNTGEIAGIFDHEWGHGLDNNGVNPNIASPGENIADTDAILRLDTSCAGRGFFKNQVCGGYGDPCIGTPATGCTGVRDLDFANHVSGLPHGISWILSNCGGGGGPCGREVHCEGQPMGEVSWDLQFRDLRAAPFNFDENTALELTTRLFYLGQQSVTSFYTCTASGGGCGATGGYTLMLGVDDDNGDLNDGTPHMTAIRSAYERHQMHCATPAPVNSGCAGGPTTAPTISVAPSDAGAVVSWPSVAGAARYDVYRTEGPNGCAFGKVKVGETTGLSFQDGGLQNGRTYFYSVLPVGSNTSCFGRMSACVTVVPAPGPNLAIRTGFSLAITGGDGDGSLDNCESGAVTFTVENTGTGTLTNVRLISVTPLTHPATVVTTPLPQTIAPSLTDCASANGNFSFTPQGMSFGEDTQLEIEVTADELGGATRTAVITIGGVESDIVAVASRNYDFETDYSGWTVIQGTYNRESPGANGTNFHLHSTQFLDNQCDLSRSPTIRLTATSTLSLYNRYDIEDPIPAGPYDRANIAVVDLDSGVRTTIVPNGGRLYDLPPGTPAGACVTGGEAGWAGTQTTFAISTWDASATNPGGMFTGKRVQLEGAYGTDPGLALEGFHFDEVTLTNFEELVPDAQSNTCGTGVNGLSITDVAVTEGNAGTTTATFTVFLSPTSGSTVTVDFATADGSATVADNDYASTSGTLTFPPGSSSQPINVTVNGDTKFEANETFFVNLSNPTNATIGDAQGQGTINNDDGVAGSTFVTELFHGYVEQDNLAAVGGVANTDYYVMTQKPLSSYEVLVDATSGDIGPTLEVQRIASDGSTVLQSSVATGSTLNFSRSLRWFNSTAAEVSTETIRVRSTGCTTDCGTDDVYGMRFFETTYAVPRFNNAGTQVTILLLQNPTDYTISGNIYFWDPAGTLLATTPFSLTPKNLLVLNTQTVAPGVSGAVTVAHDGRFGDLSGKTVALEPATGFSFDSPMLPRVKVN